jgi:hypothetical protein
MREFSDEKTTSGGYKRFAVDILQIKGESGQAFHSGKSSRSMINWEKRVNSHPSVMVSLGVLKLTEPISRCC